MRLKIISEDNGTNVYTWLNFIKTFSVTFPGNFLGAGSHKSMLIKFDIWRIITVYNSGNHHHSSVRAGTIFYTIAVILSFAKYKVSTNDLMKDFITKQIHDIKYKPNGVFTRGLFSSSALSTSSHRDENQAYFQHNVLVLQERFSLLLQ